MRLFSLISLSLAVALATGCPAEGPLEDVPDTGSTEEDMGSSGDDSGAEQELTLDAVEPGSGPLEGGTTVTLTGGGFVEGMTVRFGATDAGVATIVGPTEATVSTPAASSEGAVTVVVRTPDGTTDSLLNAFRYSDEVTGGSVDFCMLQAQSPVQAAVGQASPGIYAVVFAEGATQGAGMGAGIEGELGWGSGSDYENFDFAAMTYNLDKDGLNAGDLANDEYGTALTIDTEGSYRYAARFRRDGGDWTYCDLDGSENGVSADQLGVLDVLGEPTLSIADCHLQFPHVVDTAQTGTAVSAFGRVRVPGVTGSSMANGALTAELLAGPAGENPVTNPELFEVASASVNTNTINLGAGEDEYVGILTFMNPGAFSLAFRFSVDAGATWTYCDIDGGDFDAHRMSYVAVSPGTPDTVDFCHVWETNLDATVATSPVVTVELFEDPHTVGNGGANSGEFTAEAGYGPRNANPAIEGAFTWAPMTYKGLRPGVENNYEYEGNVWNTAPAQGDYAVAVRVRHSDDTFWTHCDADPDVAEFDVFSLTTMTVAP